MKLTLGVAACFGERSKMFQMIFDILPDFVGRHPFAVHLVSHSLKAMLVMPIRWA